MVANRLVSLSPFILSTVFAAVACGPKAKPVFDISGELANVKRSCAELSALRLEHAFAPRPGTPTPVTTIKLRSQPLIALPPEYDKTYTNCQTKLVGFLNVALNDYPKSPETLEALTIYATEALYIARFHTAHGGEVINARKSLTKVNELYKSIGAPPPIEVNAFLKGLEQGP